MRNTDVNITEYIAFFKRWLDYQFDREEDEEDKKLVLAIVAGIVSDPEDLAHWSNRDCWSMYDHVLTDCPLLKEVTL